MWMGRRILEGVGLCVVLLFCCMEVKIAEAPGAVFPLDRLSPYNEGSHGSGRSRRDIAQCQHVNWRNRTYEEHHINLLVPEVPDIQYEMHRYEDTVQSELDRSLSVHRRRYLLGSIAYVKNSYYTFSVLEPSIPGGCKAKYFRTIRSTVRATSSNRKYGCLMATNAGYFSVASGQCLGNIVSDGRVVQTTSDQNANFGIREDGAIVVGYIPEEDVLNGSYRQLIAGVVWLVRNGTNYVNESMQLECASHQDTGKMATFVNVLSARTAIGHDREGRIVIANVEGQTHKRGANLHEFANLLIAHGVVNAINLDGGGSSTFVKDQILVNYPSDHCLDNPAYRCEREVSTALCFHDVQCLEPLCNNHGTCVEGKCICTSPWIGSTCDLLNCSLTDCSNRGNCTDGRCVCDSGWKGHQCDEVCLSGSYGPGCTSTCWCYGKSVCNPVTGACKCPPGFTGFGCWKECDKGFYGPDCSLRCPDHNCSGNGQCSPVNGSCLCSPDWTGTICNNTASISLHQIDVASSDAWLISPTFPLEPTSVHYSLSSTFTPDSVLPSLVHPTPSSPQNSSHDVQQSTCECSNYGMAILVLCMTTTASVLIHTFICVKFGFHVRTRKGRHLVSQTSSSDCSI